MQHRQNMKQPKKLTTDLKIIFKLSEAKGRPSAEELLPMPIRISINSNSRGSNLLHSKHNNQSTEAQTSSRRRILE